MKINCFIGLFCFNGILLASNSDKIKLTGTITLPSLPTTSTSTTWMEWIWSNLVAYILPTPTTNDDEIGISTEPFQRIISIPDLHVLLFITGEMI